MLVIVTGASRGIGFELVKLFAADKQTHVIAVARHTGPLLKLKLKNLNVITADITLNKGRLRVLDAVKKEKRPLNILVNNAGVLVNKAFSKITEQELKLTFETNVFAPFMLIQNLLNQFKPGETSHIVNVGSMGGFQGSAKFPGLSAYSSSKSALAGLTECLAEELKAKNISVNCLAIGAVQTEMLKEAFPDYVAPLSPKQMAAFMHDFAINGSRYFNGKTLPVSSTTP